MLKAIAIDDERMALEVIKSHASKVPFITLEAAFSDGIQGLEYHSNNPVDLIFLDINMPDISGIDLMAMLPEATMVIFTTAYSEFAVKGFELNALDYLLKPFSLSRFLQACQKARDWKALQPSGEPEYIFVKTTDSQQRINFGELLYCEAAGNYVSLQLKNEKLISRMTFKELEKLLPSYFIRTHRSFMVNKNKINKIERHQVQIDEHFIPVSISYADFI
ncbi:LytR/AlgR family response regulator transcription factor [Cyclobacterium marinum]|uniref:LytR/AlgR family response regulator transcription factor n=1 Tax=Cyclobacterium marinum TaxID=104 RepID=UPI0011EFC651|nr:LytTR family DNA-binding domain-containing protein [Cyclobacterium marinum]MBI0397720.1 response regulator transcription factor [Cyclobacterium marinum]|tara:strand:- start:81808 stop:82467 length:660 start_codon:yes stop_codon:yes gene_type:complete